MYFVNYTKLNVWKLNNTLLGKMEADYVQHDYEKRSVRYFKNVG